MNRKQMRVVSLVLLVLALAVAGLGLLLKEQSGLPFLIASLVLLVAEGLLRSKYARCPHCNQVLRRSAQFSALCPLCGKSLDDAKSGGKK